jgi:hypothetical protein
MQKKMYLFKIITLLFFASSLSCKHEILIIPDIYESRSKLLSEEYGQIYKGDLKPNCGNISSGANWRLTGKFSYYSPCTNPNDTLEFVYLRTENGVTGGDDHDMFIYNFATNTSRLIARHVAYSPDWSVKNWIIFTGQNRQLFKVKSNGDSLIQLTNSGNFNNDAKWSVNGNHFIYYDASVDKMKIANSDGITERTIDIGIYKWSWGAENEIAYTYNSPFGTILHIMKLNLTTNISETIATISSSPAGAINYRNGSIYLDSDNGICVFKDGNLSICSNSYKSFVGVFTQPIGNTYYLINRGIMVASQDSCLIKQSTFISVFNRFTSVERKIQIPE